MKNKTSCSEKEAFGEQDVPVLRMLIITLVGITICFLLSIFAQNLIGEAMILLSLLLFCGLYKVSNYFNIRKKNLEKQLENKKIFFCTDARRQKRNQFIIFFTICVCLTTYYVINFYNSGEFVELVIDFINFWTYSSSEIRIDIVAVVFSFFVSIIVFSLSMLKEAELGNIIITEKGLFVRDYFLDWKEIKNFDAKNFPRWHSMHIAINTRRGGTLRIQLYDPKIDKAKADEIIDIFNKYVYKKR